MSTVTVVSPESKLECHSTSNAVTGVSPAAERSVPAATRTVHVPRRLRERPVRMRWGRGWLTAAMLLVCLTAPTAFGADGDDKVVKAVNGDLLKGLLEEEGFRGVTVEKINLTTHAVMVRMNGRTVVFLCDLDKGCVQGHFGTGGTNASLRKVNKWNEEKMFFRAFLDKDGDPAIEQDLIVKHGVTRRTVKEFVSLMELGIRAFVSEVCE